VRTHRNGLEAEHDAGKAFTKPWTGQVPFKLGRYNDEEAAAAVAAGQNVASGDVKYIGEGTAKKPVNQNATDLWQVCSLS
jgi:hypothetical protein